MLSKITEINSIIFEYAGLSCECGELKMLICETEECKNTVCYICNRNEYDPFMVHYHCNLHVYRESEEEENIESHGDWIDEWEFEDDFDGAFDDQLYS